MGTFPNGQAITTTALTPDSLLALFQTLTAQMLGLNPQSDTDPAYAAVRIDWQTQGQPGFGIGEQVAFLSAREEASEYSSVRDLTRAPNDAASVVSTYSYTRVWRVAWTFYGPACFDQARLVNEALYLDWAADALAPAHLYFVDCDRPQYVPELFSAQWWKRTDLAARYNEFVSSSLIDPTIASAEVLLFNDRGEVADLTAST